MWLEKVHWVLNIRNQRANSGSDWQGHDLLGTTCVRRDARLISNASESDRAVSLVFGDCGKQTVLNIQMWMQNGRARQGPSADCRTKLRICNRISCQLLANTEVRPRDKNATMQIRWSYLGQCQPFMISDPDSWTKRQEYNQVKGPKWDEPIKAWPGEAMKLITLRHSKIQANTLEIHYVAI